MAARLNTRQIKPRVLTKCVANCYTAPYERIIEFSFPSVADHPGGLIAFRHLSDGQLIVDVYRTDPIIKVRVAKENRS